MKNEGYIVIQGWMVNELKLVGNELMAYAIIYGFSQDNASSFYGTSKYIADSLGITKKSAVDILRRLLEKDLISKTEKPVGSVLTFEYKVNTQKICKNWGREESSIGREESSIGREDSSTDREETSVGREETTPNNKFYNKTYNQERNNNNNNIIITKKETDTQGPKRFIRPTVEQVREYCNERKNNINPESFVDFYDSKGWKVGSSPMKDWKAAVRTWENKRKQETPQQAQEPVDDLEPVINRIATGFFTLNYTLDYCKQLLAQDGDDNPFKIGFYRKNPSVLVRLTEWANGLYESTGKDKWLAYLKIVKDMLLG